MGLNAFNQATLIHLLPFQESIDKLHGLLLLWYRCLLERVGIKESESPSDVVPLSTVTLFTLSIHEPSS